MNVLKYCFIQIQTIGLASYFIGGERTRGRLWAVPFPAHRVLYSLHLRNPCNRIKNAFNFNCKIRHLKQIRGKVTDNIHAHEENRHLNVHKFYLHFTQRLIQDLQVGVKYRPVSSEDIFGRGNQALSVGNF